MDDVVDTQNSEPSWYWDDSTPGTGDRPDYLPAKFKSVADAAKGYAALEKKLGSAPESYDFSKGESWMDSNFEGFQELAQLAKDKRVPQEVFDKMLETTGDYINQNAVDYKAEYAKLGENAKERLDTLSNWAESNLSEKSFKALINNLDSAEAIEAVEELRSLSMSNETMIPNGNDASQISAPSLEDIRQEMSDNFDKYKSDAKYRAELQSKMEKAAKNSSYVDKSMI